MCLALDPDLGLLPIAVHPGLGLDPVLGPGPVDAVIVAHGEPPPPVEDVLVDAPGVLVAAVHDGRRRRHYEPSLDDSEIDLDQYAPAFGPSYKSWIMRWRCEDRRREKNALSTRPARVSLALSSRSRSFTRFARCGMLAPIRLPKCQRTARCPTRL